MMPGESTTALAAEIDFYNEHRDEWMGRIAGRVVLVKGRDLVGVYDDEEAALAEGARLFGLESFLVRRVLPSDPEVRIPALTLGVLHAHP